MHDVMEWCHAERMGMMSCGTFVFYSVQFLHSLRLISSHVFLCVFFARLNRKISHVGWRMERSSAGVVIVSSAEKALAGIDAANFDWAPGFYQSLARMSLL